MGLSDSSVVVSNPENDGTSAKPTTSVTGKRSKGRGVLKKVDTHSSKKKRKIKKVAGRKNSREAPKATVEKAAAKVAANR